MMKCEICGKLSNGFKGLSSHIRQYHKTKSQTYYDKFIKSDDEGLVLNVETEQILLILKRVI